MKQQILLVISLFLTAHLFGQKDPTILQIDDAKVTKSEFLQIYLKNNDAPKYDKASLNEYMELFKKFKLKVTEAENLGYDTIPRLKKELEGYQKQLATPYLIDSSQNEALVREAYHRMQNEVRASHILIKLNPNSLPKDTLEAYNKIIALRMRIVKGEDFAAVAKSRGGSEDPSAQDNGGDLGYFTAFQMVYPFEDMAYNTKVGEVSMPFRTRFGYHILKTTDKRKTKGTIKTAHIMFAARKGSAPNAKILEAKKKADEVYEMLQNGKKFEDLVEKYSEDPSSSKKGGLLPVFGTGSKTRMVTEFEDAAFALQNDGDISKPVKTDYGYHIIKRIEQNPLPPFEKMKGELESRVNKGERSKSTQNSFVEKLKKEYEFKDKSKKSLPVFYDLIDSTYAQGKWKFEALNKNKLLFKIDGKKFYQNAFGKFLEENYRGTRKLSGEDLVNKQYTKWQKEVILDMEKAKLPKKYPAYKALMTEYHDGILLYEVMSDKVWNKAIKDTVGLEKFFEANRSNYRWGKRIDASIYECHSKENAEKVHQLLQEGLSKDSITSILNKDSDLNLNIRQDVHEIEKLAYLKGKELQKGILKPMEDGGKFYVLEVHEVIPAGQKELSEAKGVVTSDYQTHLEKEWLKELEKKYQLTVHEDILYSLDEK